MNVRLRRLSPTVVALSLVSLFTDVGSEMIFPLLPVFLTETLRAGPAFLGLVEGAADSVASLLKLASGALSDRLRRRKPLVMLGYGLASFVRPLVAAATAPWHVLAVRLTDRVGKGIRTAPRDALIADASDAETAGRAFGFNRAMDHAGAVLGPLIAAALLGLGLKLRAVFWLAAIPGVIAFAILLSIRERARPAAAGPEPAVRPRPAAADRKPAGRAAPRTPPAGTREPRPAAAPSRSPTRLPRALHTYAGILLIFCLGNSSDAFLLLRARELGLSAAAIPILWAVLHVSKVASSLFGGALSDRIPRTRLIIIGWVIYAAVYLGLGAASGPAAAWVLFAVYGIHHGLTEPAEKALVRDLSPADARGRAYGLYNFIIGISALPAGLLTGWLWHARGPRTALALGGALAAVASILLALWSARRRGSVATA